MQGSSEGEDSIRTLKCEPSVIGVKKLQEKNILRSSVEPQVTKDIPICCIYNTDLQSLNRDR